MHLLSLERMQNFKTVTPVDIQLNEAAHEMRERKEKGPKIVTLLELYLTLFAISQSKTLRFVGMMKHHHLKTKEIFSRKFTFCLNITNL